MNNIAYLLALHSIDGLGPIRLKAILKYFQDPKLAWEASAKQIIKLGVPQTVVNSLLDTRKNLDPITYAQTISDSGIKWLTVFDDGYPKLLKEIYDPPAVFYYKGEINDWNKPAVAIVGSRNMTGYGKMVTEQFAKGLSNAGLVIVSGLARGVDAAAHLATVVEGGSTIAVLGGGLNNIFPPENKSLAEKIANGFGAVISEFPPNYSALPGNFPVRNRIISGLSLAVIVIEAAQKSGSLITARLALEQGREVFAFSGSIASALSEGPVDLISKGAKAVFSAEDILEELGINKVIRDKGLLISENISEEEKKVLGILENESMSVNEIGRQLQLSSLKISALLLKMEISGLVQSVGAGIYCRK